MVTLDKRVSPRTERETPTEAEGEMTYPSKGEAKNQKGACGTSNSAFVSS